MNHIKFLFKKMARRTSILPGARPANESLGEKFI
jgi:hypothetical protein